MAGRILTPEEIEVKKEKRRLAQARYRSKNPEKVLAQGAKWRAENPGYSAEWCKNNPEKAKLKSARWAEKNPSKVKDRQARWRAENPGYSSKYRAENIEKLLDKEALYRSEKFEMLKDRNAKYRTENPAKIKANRSKWDSQNPNVGRAKSAKRRALKTQRTFDLLSERHDEIFKKIYVSCPQGCHVDHIIPLQGKNVSGLHVPWNLQILTETENSSKINKFDGTYENESWRKEMITKDISASKNKFENKKNKKQGK